MKKLIFLLAVFAMGFLNCKKEKATTVVKTDNITLENATVIVAGNLSFVLKSNAGTVKVYRQENGKYVLGLEEMKLNSGTSLLVYLSPTKTVSPSSVKVCSVISLSGDAYFLLPATVDFAVFKYLIIQTERSAEIVATAELS